MSRLTGRQRGRHVKWRGPVMIAALTALLGVPASAPAQQPAAPNMFDTNVPYVAWRGEQVKAVKCDSIPAIDDGDGTLQEAGLHTDILVESWSGPGRDPQVESGTVHYFRSENLDESRRDCVKFDMVSSDPGLARVKLVVSDADGTPVLKHQFLFVWMSLGNVSIKEATNNDPPVPAGSAAAVADPSGDGNFTAGEQAWNQGRVQVKLTGTFPHPLAPGGTFTLPQDWPTIAGALATDSNSYNDDSLLWDIHDDQGMGAEHVPGFCAPVGNSGLDDVDNCQGGGDLGPFSNQFGQGVSAGGPFDPARPETLLSNGRLNADDAPMPAARIDVAIKPNSGSPADISGVGSLQKADKTELYSRNGYGTSNAHNLYAPYYVQWIPATSEGSPEASGVDGPQRGNNFEGFFLDGAYDNWSTFPLMTGIDSATNCNQYVSWRQTLGIDGGSDVPRRTPSGDQTVAVYTDEHGEAQVEYQPGNGFYFNNLPTLRNDNRGCDLQDVDTLGTSDIAATARYPYQPVDDGPRTTATIRKTVANAFDKSLSYYPKGPVTATNTANDNARIVVAHANDIDGTPFDNELVCWMVDQNGEGALPFSGETGPADGRFNVQSDPAFLANLAFKAAGCARTDDNGNVALEVFNSNGNTVNVIALFADEGLLRDIKVNFGQPGSSGGTPPPVPPKAPAVKVDERPVSGAGTTVPSVQEIAAAGGPAAVAALKPSVTKVKAAKVKKARIALARTKLAHGKRSVWVRVNSSKKSEKIVIRIGKRKIVRSVRTNKLVKVSGVSVAKSATISVRLAS